MQSELRDSSMSKKQKFSPHHFAHMLWCKVQSNSKNSSSILHIYTHVSFKIPLSFAQDHIRPNLFYSILFCTVYTLCRYSLHTVLACALYFLKVQLKFEHPLQLCTACFTLILLLYLTVQVYTQLAEVKHTEVRSFKKYHICSSQTLLNNNQLYKYFSLLQ